ncbi:CocE/NonD family hydrolase [Tahibacter caeni]|uniref:CocE/NonD family hydrolase n=1 Tax=Tahibacter caeni TaxID=1453545 RepID=UPI0021476E00|nr:CocE/NonD family hydrolase [Tahibacter caeni]
MLRITSTAALLLAAFSAIPAAAQTPVDLQWGVKIPLRDGVELQATLYRPQGQREGLPCILSLTPYIAQNYHDRGMYFAANGYVFASVDVRGRGNSGGTFTPFLQEARDGHDIVEWLATQSYCNGKITMWGGSYGGYDQWATAKEKPAHLATIVPVAAVQPGLDFPMRNNVFYPYDMRWLTYVSGRATQDKLFGDNKLWTAQFRSLFEAHAPFNTLDARIGNPSPIFQEWAANPLQGPYWDRLNPTAEQYAALDFPILTITGQYDGDQPGALAFYRQHMQHGPATARERHYLIIGPWDHAGTRTPPAEYAGLKFGAASQLDMNALHKAWYDWTLKSGAKPEFLKNRVAYYVTGPDEWRYADSLEAITASERGYFLASDGGRANDVYASGRLEEGKARRSGSDRYVYDPLDVSLAADDAADQSGAELLDQAGVLRRHGKQLVYHTAPLAADTDIAGFFRLSAWLRIDQPDTDFNVDVYAIAPDGSSLFLTSDVLRARHRESLRESRLAVPGKVERYDFERFTFVARRLVRGSRLRLVIGPVNSFNLQKNYNSGGVVNAESAKDARTVTVELLHDARHPSALYVPIAAERSVMVVADKR